MQLRSQALVSWEPQSISSMRVSTLDQLLVEVSHDLIYFTSVWEVKYRFRRELASLFGTCVAYRYPARIRGSVPAV